MSMINVIKKGIIKKDTFNELKDKYNLSKKHDDKGNLKIFDKENGGTISTRNISLENANGEFIKFVDANDYLRIDILEKMKNIMYL